MNHKGLDHLFENLEFKNIKLFYVWKLSLSNSRYKSFEFYHLTKGKFRGIFAWITSFQVKLGIVTFFIVRWCKIFYKKLINEILSSQNCIVKIAINWSKYLLCVSNNQLQMYISKNMYDITEIYPKNGSNPIVSINFPIPQIWLVLI